MKVGEGGEAFFVFETLDSIPRDLQTSPLVSPETSPLAQPTQLGAATGLDELEPLDLTFDDKPERDSHALIGSSIERPKSVDGMRYKHRTQYTKLNSTPGTRDPHEGPLDPYRRPVSGDWSAFAPPSEPFTSSRPPKFDRAVSQPLEVPKLQDVDQPDIFPLKPENAVYDRAVALSKRLLVSQIRSQISPSGDLMIDMTDYKSDEDEALRTERVARQILSEEIKGFDIGSLIGVDAKGNVWVYGSAEAKEAADRKAGLASLNPLAMRSTDAVSDPGYHSDDAQSDSGSDVANKPRDHIRRDSDSALGYSQPGSPEPVSDEPRQHTKHYAKTLRLTNDQLKSLDLKPGANRMSFTVNKATCSAYIYLWRHDVPIVISDIDGTITK